MILIEMDYDNILNDDIPLIPITIALDKIVWFGPHKDNRKKKTTLTTVDGSGFDIAHSYPQVKKAIAQAQKDALDNSHGDATVSISRSKLFGSKTPMSQTE